MSGVKGKSGKGSGGPGKGQGPPFLGRNIRFYCTEQEKHLIETVRSTDTDPETLRKSLIPNPKWQELYERSMRAEVAKGPENHNYEFAKRELENIKEVSK